MTTNCSVTTSTACRLDGSHTSAVILQDEPESALFLTRIETADIRVISAAASVEASIIVLARRGDAGLMVYREFVADLNIETVPILAAHVELAVEAFARYGKGRHVAALNFGDCFSYALAKATDQPLLFKGWDFLHTDIKRAM